MKILVIGCGSIGKRHIRNLLSVGVDRVAACDINDKKRNEVKREFSIEVFIDLEEALLRDRYEAAFICTPPGLHVQQARQVLANGLHCFIEKPLSHTLAGIDEIIALADQAQKTVMIGYNLRFSPYLRRIKDMIDGGHIGKVLFLKASVGYYLPHWRPHEDYRQGYGSKQDLGGGIILDASHEIDYVRHLLGEVTDVLAVCRRLSNLAIETEDFAEITMRHRNGAYSQIHLDYLQSNYRRSCEIIGDKGMLIWDINERNIRTYSLNDKEYHTFYEGLNADINDMYKQEIKHFFQCIAGKEKPFIDLVEGKRIQEIIMKIKESSDKKCFLSV